MGSYFGFLFLKNLRGIPHKNIQQLLGGGVSLSFVPTMSHSRRRHSAGSFFKSWTEDSEYLLLIVGREGLEPPMFCLKTFDLQSKPFAATVTYPTLKNRKIEDGRVDIYFYD